jgi:hypothetical protein
MTPAEAGVREYCANTREKGAAAMLRVVERNSVVLVNTVITLANSS